MIFRTFLLIGLLSGNFAAAATDVDNDELEHLDLELEVEGGERQLFPLLPGTKCPTGHVCHKRATGMMPSSSAAASLKDSIKRNYKTHLQMSMDWEELGKSLDSVVVSNNYCTRRAAMQRAAGLAAGLAISAVSQPAYAAETKEVKMGSDSGGLQFVPAKVSICKGDSVKWINNQAGPHNVVFDEDAIPEGVSQESISMIDDQLGEEGETFVKTFTTPGSYDYYCEPHRGAGMNGVLTVTA